jgi:uncharacterized protein
VVDLEVSLSQKEILFSLLGLVFLSGILFITYNMLLGFLFTVLFLLLIHISVGRYRVLTSIFIAFLLSFFIVQMANHHMVGWSISKELKVIFNRSLLIVIVGGLLGAHCFMKERISLFSKLPNWNSRISMPFHTIKLPYFLLIGLIVSSTILIPPIFYQEFSYFKSTFLFAVAFSIINATLEEIIWRGLLLSSLKRNVSTFYAIVITSLGFGLLHISIGIPVMISLLMSFGGLFYAMVVFKTNSIYPSIVFHIIINLGMVFNGWII